MLRWCLGAWCCLWSVWLHVSNIKHSQYVTNCTLWPCSNETHKLGALSTQVVVSTGVMGWRRVWPSIVCYGARISSIAVRLSFCLELPYSFGWPVDDNDTCVTLAVLDMIFAQEQEQLRGVGRILLFGLTRLCGGHTQSLGIRQPDTAAHRQTQGLSFTKPLSNASVYS